MKSLIIFASLFGLALSSCCSRIQLVSDGGAAETYPGAMGVFTLGRDENGRQIYNHENGQYLAWLKDFQVSQSLVLRSFNTVRPKDHQP